MTLALTSLTVHRHVTFLVQFRCCRLRTAARYSRELRTRRLVDEDRDVACRGRWEELEIQLLMELTRPAMSFSSFQTTVAEVQGGMLHCDASVLLSTQVSMLGIAFAVTRHDEISHHIRLSESREMRKRMSAIAIASE